MAKRAASKPASDRFLQDTKSGAAIAAGMVPDQWNAAVRLQAAVRNGIDRPVDLVQALTIAREVVTLAIAHVDIERFRKQFDDNVLAARVEKDRQAKEISANAGRR